MATTERDTATTGGSGQPGPEIVVPEEVPAPVLVRGTKTLLIGPPGAGKTWCLPTLIEAGLELFVIITDPGGEEALLDSMDAHDLPLDNLHWKYISSASPSWDTLYKMGGKINTMTYEAITKIKTGIEKQDYQQYMQLIAQLFDFECDRTGETYGAVDSWGPDRALAIDTLSGVNTMSMDMMIGAKPAAHQGEWGVAMNAEEKLIKKLCADLKCFFILNAHIEREPDEIAGQTQIMVSCLGRRLAPKLPKDFSDVVLSYREGKEFFWSTVAPNVDLKARTLPLENKLQPSFGQVVEAWRKRVALTEA